MGVPNNRYNDSIIVNLLFEVPIVDSSPSVVLEIRIPVFGPERVLSIQHITANCPLVLLAG